MTIGRTRSDAPGQFRIAIVNSAFEPDIDDPDALLQRYHMSTGWANALAEAGLHDITLVQRFWRNLTLHRGQIDYHFVADDGPTVPSTSFWGSRVTHDVRALKPDVVHVDGLVFPLLVRHLRIALPRRTAILVQDHGGIHARSSAFKHWPWRALHRLGLSAADGFLFTAREQAVPWQQARIFDASQAIHEVLESSVDLQQTQTSSDERPALPGRPALLWVGRLNANKDPLTVLRGFERAAEALPNAALTLVFSEAPLLTRVTSEIASSAFLRSRVHLRGWVERSQLPALYAAADVFLLGSHHESAGVALIEALSFGVTPIVTDISAFRAITACEKVGALFPPGDVVALTRALKVVSVADRAGNRRLTREYFERELSWRAVGRRAIEIYRAAAFTRQSSMFSSA